MPKISHEFATPGFQIKSRNVFEHLNPFTKASKHFCDCHIAQQRCTNQQNDFFHVQSRKVTVITDVVMGFRLVGSQMSGLFGHVSKSLKNAKLRNNEKF